MLLSKTYHFSSVFFYNIISNTEYMVIIIKLPGNNYNLVKTCYLLIWQPQKMFYFSFCGGKRQNLVSFQGL